MGESVGMLYSSDVLNFYPQYFVIHPPGNFVSCGVIALIGMLFI